MSPEEIKAARELLLLLSKAAKAVRIYARNNDVFIRFWNELTDGMSRYLGITGRLSLQIEATEIRMGEELLYEFDKKDDNFAFRLYKDGLRKLDFVQGLTSDELDHFLRIITTDFERGEQAERDAVSLIWEADFRHIQILSVDSFAEEDQADDGSSDEKAQEDDEEKALIDGEIEQIATELQRSAELKLMKLDHEEKRQYSHLTSGSAEFEERNALDHGSIFHIAPQVKDQLRAEVESERGARVEDERVAEILFEIFRQEPPGEYPEIIHITLGVIDALLAEGNLPAANMILYPLRLLTIEEYSRAFSQHENVLELFRRLGKPEHMEFLLVAIREKRVQGGHGAVFGFLSLMVAENIPGILKCLERIEDDELRRGGVDALVTVSEGDLSPFIAMVRSGNPRLVADIIHAMGHLADVSSLEVVLGAFGHAEAVVREAVLVALRSFESPRARDIMHSALNDPAEPVRLAAMRYVAVHRDQLAGQMLIEQIQASTFRQRSFTELRAICMTVAHIHGRAALPLLSNLLKQKRHTESVIAAIHGLSVIGGSDARRLLEPLARGGAVEVTEEARKLLARMK